MNEVIVMAMQQRDNLIEESGIASLMGNSHV